MAEVSVRRLEELQEVLDAVGIARGVLGTVSGLVGGLSLGSVTLGTAVEAVEGSPAY